MTAAIAVLVGVFTCYVIGAWGVLRAITPRERRQLSRRQRAIIRYYKGAPLA